jgi:hypothetical protein
MQQCVSEINITEQLARAVSKALKITHEKLRGSNQKELERAIKSLKVVEQKEDQAYDNYCDGILDDQQYKRQLERIQKEKDSLQHQIDLSEKTISNSNFYQKSDSIIELAKSSKSLWNSQPKEEKLKLLKLILSNQTLTLQKKEKKHVSLEYRLKEPFKELAKIKKAASKSGFLTTNSKWCPDADSNHGHRDFQSLALPTELSGRTSQRCND